MILIKTFGSISIWLLVLCLANQASFAEELKKESSQPINISSEELRVFKNKNMAIFEGKVHAIQGDMNLYCDKMTVYFEEKAEQVDTVEVNEEDGIGKSKVERINFVGNVNIVTPQENAKSEVGEYNVKTGIFTLTGNVELVQQKNKLNGHKLIYNKNTGESLLTNKTSGIVNKKQRVKAILIPEESSEKKVRN